MRDSERDIFIHDRLRLEDYQLARLKESLMYVQKHSAFYTGRLPEISVDSLRDLQKLPFTYEEDIKRHGDDMLCVPRSSVKRIVSVPTGGTTGNPKRILFTENDLELMIDYVHHGLALLADPGDVFMLLMPCEKPGSIGDLVAKGLARRGVIPLPYGILPPDGSDDDKAISAMKEKNVKALLATPGTAGRLAEKSAGGLRLRSVLLSAEYVSPKAARDIEKAWNCKVYEHYGMTEMGLGGAMMCEARQGYHVREEDLLFEIIEPETGCVCEDGDWGEIVFTTLTREAMPLIRYRTGDTGRFLCEACPCGSVYKRLDRVRDRKAVKSY